MFNEPGVFLVRPDGTHYYAAMQSMPFARPNFGDLRKAVDFAIDKDYPARGESLITRRRWRQNKPKITKL